jgi:hypothetical protein
VLCGGWVDQKNEATGLVRGALDAVSGRLARTGGLARHELVVAAHTTLVLAAFFDTLREALGDEYEDAEFTEAEKVMLGTGKWQRDGEQLVRHLYAAEVPSPSAVRGFEENVDAVARWAIDRLAGLLAQPAVPQRDVRARLAEINRAELDRPVIDIDIDGYGIDSTSQTWLTTYARWRPPNGLS